MGVLLFNVGPVIFVIVSRNYHNCKLLMKLHMHFRVSWMHIILQSIFGEKTSNDRSILKIQKSRGS